MEEFSKLLNISNNVTMVYISCLGKLPLTRNEIHSFNSNISIDEVDQFLKILVEKKLLIQINHEQLPISSHYFAIPPLNLINDVFNEVKQILEKDGYAQKAIQLINENVFIEDNSNEIDNIQTNFTQLLKDLNNNVVNLKGEIKELNKQINEISDSKDLLDKYEVELKNIISSELASIVVTLLQLKSDLKEKITEAGINDNQWDLIKDSIKDILALTTHEKSLEINEIISEEFNEINSNIKLVGGNVLKEIYDQKVSFLKILEVLHNEFYKIDNELSVFRNNTKTNLLNLKNQSTIKMLETFQKITNPIAVNTEFIIKFLEVFLKSYTNPELLGFDKFWLIRSTANFKEEIQNIILNSKKKILVIVPKIEEFLDKEQLEKCPKEIEIKISSTDSLECELINNLLKHENIEFRKIRDKNIFGIIGDEKVTLIGVLKDNQEEIIDNLIGFGTDFSPILNLINSILYKIWKEEAQAPVISIIADNLNQIIKNINELKGNEIGEIMKTTLDLIVDIEGTSLDTLETKLFISKLRGISKPLDNNLKEEILEKIKKINEATLKMNLYSPPELIESKIKEKIVEDLRPADEPQIRTIFPKIEIENISKSHIENFFNIFLEKIDTLNGQEISQNIEKLTELIFAFQGNNEIINWRNELKSIDTELMGPFKVKIKEDFINWKNSILSNIYYQQDDFQTKALETNISEKQKTTETKLEKKNDNLIKEEIEKLQDNIPIEKESEKVTVLDIKQRFDLVEQNLENLSGLELNKKLQDIIDIILETKGYSVSLKEMKSMNDRLRKIKETLSDELKIELRNAIDSWKIKFG